MFIVLAYAVANFPPSGKIPVLTYHFIGSEHEAEKHKDYVSKRSFSWQMAFLDFLNYRVISLDDLYAIKTAKRKPMGRELVITFDNDGGSFEETALPVLEKYTQPVGLFVVSESVKRGIHNNMSPETLRELYDRGWITVASHSKTHPILARMTVEQIEEELHGSKVDLEALLERPIRYLAYPNGELDQRVIDIAASSGYLLSFTDSYKGFNGDVESLHNLPRVRITRTADNLFVFWAKVSGIYQWFKRLRFQLKGIPAKV